jgi:hypothetical protein
VFRLILNEMLATTRGSLAAIFLDWEGETVELVCDRDLNDHDLRILGAYQGIFLDKLRTLCSNADAGPPQRFKIEFADTRVLSFDVKDGYYIVLLVDASANEGLAWRKLERCREQLLAEM